MPKIPQSSIPALKKILSSSQHPAAPDFSEVSDVRNSQGKRHAFESLLKLSFCGMLAAFRALRDVTSFALRRGYSISHVTLYLLFSRLQIEPFRQVLHQQVRHLYRAKTLEPVNFPYHQLAVDNKTLYYGKKKLNDGCQRRKKGTRYHLRTLRATLVSSQIKTALDQQIMPPATNEKGFFITFFDGLQKAYGRGLLKKPLLVSGDAGITSLKNANYLAEKHFYLLALKKGQRKLYAQAHRLFYYWPSMKADYVGGWEPYKKGQLIQRILYRSKQVEGFCTTSGKWEHLREVWLLVTRVCKRIGRKKKGRRHKREKPHWGKPQLLEKRFFLTSLPSEKLKPWQRAQAIRNHWYIENETHWTTDTQWNEDDSPWCRKNNALAVLSLLRLMAYNMIQWLKKRRIRNNRMQNWRWKDWFECLKEVMASVISFKRKLKFV